MSSNQSGHRDVHDPDEDSTTAGSPDSTASMGDIPSTHEFRGYLRASVAIINELHSDPKRLPTLWERQNTSAWQFSNEQGPIDSQKGSVRPLLHGQLVNTPGPLRSATASPMRRVESAVQGPFSHPVGVDPRHLRATCADIAASHTSQDNDHAKDVPTDANPTWATITRAVVATARAPASAKGGGATHIQHSSVPPLGGRAQHGGVAQTAQQGNQSAAGDSSRKDSSATSRQHVSVASQNLTLPGSASAGNGRAQTTQQGQRAAPANTRRRGSSSSSQRPRDPFLADNRDPAEARESLATGGDRSTRRVSSFGRTGRSSSIAGVRPSGLGNEDHLAHAVGLQNSPASDRSGRSRAPDAAQPHGSIPNEAPRTRPLPNPRRNPPPNTGRKHKRQKYNRPGPVGGEEGMYNMAGINGSRNNLDGSFEYKCWWTDYPPALATWETVANVMAGGGNPEWFRDFHKRWPTLARPSKELANKYEIEHLLNRPADSESADRSLQNDGADRMPDPTQSGPPRTNNVGPFSVQGNASSNGQIPASRAPPGTQHGVPQGPQYPIRQTGQSNHPPRGLSPFTYTSQPDNIPHGNTTLQQHGNGQNQDPRRPQAGLQSPPSPQPGNVPQKSFAPTQGGKVHSTPTPHIASRKRKAEVPPTPLT